MENLKSMDKCSGIQLRKTQNNNRAIASTNIENVLKILQWAKLKPDANFANFVNQSENC